MDDELFQSAFDSREAERLELCFQEFASSYAYAHELPRTIAVDPVTEQFYTGYKVTMLLDAIADPEIRGRVIFLQWSERDIQPGGRIRWRKVLSMPAAAPEYLLKSLATRSMPSSTPASKADSNCPTL